MWCDVTYHGMWRHTPRDVNLRGTGGLKYLESFMIKGSSEIQFLSTYPINRDLLLRNLANSHIRARNRYVLSFVFLFAGYWYVLVVICILLSKIVERLFKNKEIRKTRIQATPKLHISDWSHGSKFGSNASKVPKHLRPNKWCHSPGRIPIIIQLENLRSRVRPINDKKNCHTITIPPQLNYTKL